MDEDAPCYGRWRKLDGRPARATGTETGNKLRKTEEKSEQERPADRDIQDE
jgi:hypothetical protein